MAVDWSLQGRPVNVLESLQVLGASQDRARQEQERQAQMQAQQSEASRLANFNRDLIASYNPMTGQQDASAARLAFANAGDGKGYADFQDKQNQDFAGRRKAINEPYAQAIMDVFRLPPEQQPARFEQYKQQFMQQHPDQADTIAQFQWSPEWGRAFLAQTGHLDDFNKAAEPRYEAVGEQGLQGFQFGQPIAGGSQGPSMPTQGPKVGDVEDGYTFKGGDPADPANWAQGGGAGNGAGNFPG